MTYESLLLMFVGGSLMTFGLLAIVIGFFLGLLSPKQKFERASLVFLLGTVAVVTGAWLMRLL
jgi:nitrate reductase gamma subunit